MKLKFPDWNNPAIGRVASQSGYQGSERLLEQFLQTKLETLIGFEPKQNS